MLDKLMTLLGKATQLAPEYRPEFCIAVKKSVGACSSCRDVCPHEAIAISQQVVIDEIDCTGCGLCVEICPSQALSASMRLRPDGAVKCSQVEGSAQTVTCLAKLQPTDLLRVGVGHEHVEMVRGDCDNCPVGAHQVVPAIGRIAKSAEALGAFRKRALTIDLRRAPELSVEEKSSSLSRRDLFRLGSRGLRSGASQALAMYEFGENGDRTLPNELKHQYGWLKQAKPPGDAIVPWRLPRVAEACILCPVCTNVCPTRAFERELDPPEQGGIRLWLSPERCNGCDACVASCPVKVITLDDNVTWDELHNPFVVAKREPVRRSVPT